MITWNMSDLRRLLRKRYIHILVRVSWHNYVCILHLFHVLLLYNCIVFNMSNKVKLKWKLMFYAKMLSKLYQQLFQLCINECYWCLVLGNKFRFPVWWLILWKHCSKRQFYHFEQRGVISFGWHKYLNVISRYIKNLQFGKFFFSKVVFDLAEYLPYSINVTSTVDTPFN